MRNGIAEGFADFQRIDLQRLGDAGDHIATADGRVFFWIKFHRRADFPLENLRAPSANEQIVFLAHPVDNRLVHRVASDPQ